MVAVCEEPQAKGTGVERATRRTAGTEVREVGCGVGGWDVSGLWAALGLPFYSETGSLCGIPGGEWHGQIDILQESLWLRMVTVCKWAGQRLGEHVGAVTAPGKCKTQIRGKSEQVI